MPIMQLKVKLEAEALGPVMIILKKTPGVIGWDIDEETFGGPPKAKVSGKKIIEVALDQFGLGETVTTDQVATAIGGARPRAYGVLNQLSKKKLIRSISQGTWALTAKGRALLGLPAQKLLPAPKAKAKPATKAKGNGHKKPGHAPGGSGPQAIRDMILKRGPLRPMEIRDGLAEFGISPKGLSGLMFRCKRDGLIKVNADGRYQLTAKSEG